MEQTCDLNLSRTEQRHGLYFRTAFDGIAVWSEIGLFVDANPALCQLLGYPHEELLRLHAADVADDLTALRRHLDTVLSRGGNRCETRLRCRDGTLIDVEVSSTLLRVDGQRLVQGICRDVSARKRTEEALRRAEEALREERDFVAQVLETADALIMVADAAGHVLRFNGKCTAVSGFREEEARRRLFWDFLLPDPAEDRGPDAFACLRSGPARPHPGGPSTGAFESLWRTRSGAERLIVWRISAVRDGQGGARYFIGVGLDVTEQRRLEEQVAQARKMETLATLVGGIAHDFNNQLTAILGNLGLVLADLRQLEDRGSRIEDRKGGNGAPAEEARSSILHPPSSLLGLKEPVADAERAAQRCADMTRRLLTFSRRRIHSPRTLHLEPLVTEVVRRLQGELPPVFRVEIETPPESWPVLADGSQLQEALLALTTNARDAMPHGGTLTLATAHRVLGPDDRAANPEAQPGCFVELLVRDTGCGMTPEVRTRLFEPFFTTKGVGQGTGLGLAMVYGIVKAHGGWITVASAPGAGSTFRLFLPAAANSGVTPSRVAPAPTVAARACVLVVDDEPLVRDLGRCVLERFGYRVLTASEGEEALAVYRSRGGEIDLVLLDYTMPRLNGLQVMEALRTINPRIRIVFTSGYTMDSDANQLLSAGARAFVPKPYRTNDLVQTIQRVLEEK